MRRAGLAPVAIFLVAFLALVPWLGDRYAWPKDEARLGLVIKEMMATGEWWVPKVGDGVYSKKPPLYPWLVALLSRRGLTEWTLRLPAALAAAATVAVTYLIGARLVAPAAGLVAAGLLAASPLFFQWGRIGRMESLLALFITLAFWSLARWLDGGRRVDALLFGIWVGLGVLTKGPAALLPVAAGALALLCLRGRWPGRAWDLALGLACGGGVLLLWVGIAAARAPDFGRYAAGLVPLIAQEMGRRAQHRLYGAGVVALGFLPWSLLLPGVLVLLVRFWRDARRPLLLPLVWAGVVLVVFTIIISPREVYLLPMFPALALLVGWAWHTAPPRARWWLVAPLGVGLGVLAAAGVAVTLAPQAIVVHGVPVPLPRWFGTAAAVAAGGLGGAAYFLLRRGRPATATTVLASGTLALLLVGEVFLQTPVFNRVYPVRPTAERFHGALPPDAEVAFVDLKHVTALVFYLPRRTVQLPSLEAIRDLDPARRVYLLLPELEFAAVQGTMRLPVRRVDDVEMDGTVYVLAALRDG